MMSRVRVLPGLLLAGLAAFALVAASAARAFDLEDVAARAEKLSREPYHDPKADFPRWLADITYDQWRDIRFRTDRSLWRDDHLPFEVQFFHAGLYYDRTVAIDVIEDGEAKPMKFSRRLFDYGKNKFGSRVPDDLGFAGFRVHYPLNKPEYRDELIVFLGASYFRALGRHQVYGLSARGIAIDTIASTREEFPSFREFWLVRPAEDAKSLTVFALLDGPSLTGAYRFVIEPGDQTVINVDVRLFPRRKVEKFGVAPLTSMFYHGENTLRPFVDFRPEVHDSDGLLLSFETGEWLWRPLENPAAIQVNTFQMHNPRGFGLLQRDRAFEHHQDLETRTDLRPSVWIATRGDWGDGSVELVQLPTNTDINDNIVSYWVPSRPPGPGESLSLSYSMYWYADDPARPPAGRAISTRRDWGTMEDVHRFVVDFDGPGLQALTADQAPKAVVSVAGGDAAGELKDKIVVKNPVTGGWRLAFQLRPKQSAPIELRAFLEGDAGALTETWSYAILP